MVCHDKEFGNLILGKRCDRRHTDVDDGQNIRARDMDEMITKGSIGM